MHFVCTESFHLSLCLGCLQEPLESGNAVFGFCICCLLELPHPGAILVPSWCHPARAGCAMAVLPSGPCAASPATSPAGSTRCPRPFLSWNRSMDGCQALGRKQHLKIGYLSACRVSCWRRNLADLGSAAFGSVTLGSPR